jgi:phospholipase D1/2
VGDIIHTGAGKAVRTVTRESNDQEPLESNAGDRSLAEERTMESRDHEKVHGFPSSIVPTMEEKVVMESLGTIHESSGSSEEIKGEKGKLDKASTPRSGDDGESQEQRSSMESKNQDVKPNGDAQALETKRDPGEAKTSKSAKPLRDTSMSSVSSASREARVENGELYGAPADASRDSKTDDQPPHAVSGKNDATETEEKAVHARAEIRKHLSTKFNPKTWTLSTPTPKVDPHGFEDPISDEFWKKVWMASAVHNVSRIHLVRYRRTLRPLLPLLDRDLSQGVPCCPRRSRHHLEAV